MLWYGWLEFEDGSVYEFYARSKRVAQREIDSYLKDYDIKDWGISKYYTDVYYVDN